MYRKEVAKAKNLLHLGLEKRTHKPHCGFFKQMDFLNDPAIPKVPQEAYKDSLFVEIKQKVSRWVNI